MIPFLKDLLKSQEFWSFLYFIAWQIPFLLVFLAGIIIALVTRKRIGKASIFAMIAFLLLLLSSFITIGHQIWYLFWVLLTPSRYDFQSLSTIYLVENIARTLLEIIAWILLFLAIFVKRRE